MSGVSPELFQFLSTLVIDPKFSTKIPKNCSYSSGDVIPSSHWALSILTELKNRNGYSVQAGDIMNLINGNFLQVGYAASLVKKIRRSWLFFIELSSIANEVSQSNRSNKINIYMLNK